MELFYQYKDIIKDLLTIIGLIITIYAGYKSNFHKWVIRLWNQYIKDNWRMLVGTKKLSEKIDNLSSVIEASARAQSMFVQNIMGGMDAMNEKIESISIEHKMLIAEVTPNGGGSIRDSLNRIEASQWSRDYEDTNFLICNTDTLGNVTRVNRIFTQIVGRSESEITGTGWINTIAPHDRDRIVREWYDAVKNKRDYETSFSLIDTNKKLIPVTTRATRLMDGKKNIIGYTARITIT